MRGSFKKKQAKVISVSHKFGKIFLEGIQRAKRDGTKVNVPFNPRALQINTLNMDDKMRLSSKNEVKTEVKTAAPKSDSGAKK